MKITFLTLFPEFYQSFLKNKIISRAIDNKLVEIEIVNIRDYSNDKHRHVDDTPYGGGAGMIMRVDVVSNCIKAVKNANSKVYLMSPKGLPYNQKLAHKLKNEEHLILLAGHYEGIDDRIKFDLDGEISIGDYILTGGELSSQVIADSIIRLLDGAISDHSIIEESFENDLLEYPQYTRPVAFNGHKVPEILLSGNHKLIDKYRLKAAIRDTYKYRPDLLEKHIFTTIEKELLLEVIDEENNN